MAKSVVAFPVPRLPSIKGPWRRVVPMLAPSVDESLRQLEDLRQALGTWEDVCYVLRVGPQAVKEWKVKRRFSRSVRSLVHLTWAMLLHPELQPTLFDLQTWGRFRRIETRRPRAPAESFATVAEVQFQDGEGI